MWAFLLLSILPAQSAVPNANPCRTLFTTVFETTRSVFALREVPFDLGNWEQTQTWINSVLGTKAQLKLFAPPTLPTSGAKVYLVKHPDSTLPIAVLKTYPSTEDQMQEYNAHLGIENLRMRFTEVVPILAKGPVGLRDEPAVIKEYSPNLDFDARLRNYAQETDPIEKQTAKERYLAGLESLAFSMTEFHNRSRRLGWQNYETQEFQQHELGRLGEAVTELEQSEHTFTRYLKSIGIKPAQIKKIIQNLKKSSDEFRGYQIQEPSLIYADAHPGNFTFEMFSGEIGVFDLAWASFFIEGPHSADPNQDIARFAAGTLVTALDAGLSVEEALELRRHLFEHYYSTREDYVAVLQALRFYELRFFSVVLHEGLRTGPKKNSESTRKKVAELMATLTQDLNALYQPDQFHPQSIPGQEHWAQYDRDYRSTMELMIRSNRDAFAEAKRLGDRYIRYAEEVWGFRFEEPIYVPTMSEIAEKQHEFVHRNGFDRNALRMARVYLLPDGEEIWRQFGAPVPRTARPYDGYPVVPNKLALKMFVRRYFLAAENLPFKNRKVKAANITISGHDSLGHHTTFALNPMFAASLIDGAIEFLSDPNLEELGNPIQRWAHLFEIGDLIDAKDRPKLLTQLDYPLIPRDESHYQLDAVRAHLAKKFKRRTALEKYSKQAIELFGQLVNSFGGALADQVQWRVRFRQYGERPELRPNQSLRWLATQLEKSIAEHARLPVLIDRLAKFQTAMIESTHLSPESWVEQAMQRKMDSSSELYRYICLGGFFQPGTQFFDAYCK